MQEMRVNSEGPTCVSTIPNTSTLPASRDTPINFSLALRREATVTPLAFQEHAETVQEAGTVENLPDHPSDKKTLIANPGSVAFAHRDKTPCSGAVPPEGRARVRRCGQPACSAEGGRGRGRGPRRARARAPEHCAPSDSKGRRGAQRSRVTAPCRDRAARPLPAGPGEAGSPWPPVLPGARHAPAQ